MNGLASSLLVGCGAFVGANARFWIFTWVKQWWTLPYPMATSIINILGCLVIGFVMAFTHKPAWVQPLFVVGVLGGFTTFSAFGWESFELFRTGQAPVALLYIAVSLALGLLGTGVGWLLAQPFLR